MVDLFRQNQAKEGNIAMLKTVNDGYGFSNFIISYIGDFDAVLICDCDKKMFNSLLY